MNHSSKLNEITILQSFGIFLVVLGHSYPVFHYSFLADWVYNFIYSFHMPLFMCISGFLFIYTGGIKQTYSRFLKNKASRLLLPYFILSSIAFVPKTFLSQFAMRSTELSLEVYIKSLFYPDENAISFFWFLPTLFLIFIVSPLLSKGLKHAGTIAAITFLLMLAHLYNPLENLAFLKVEHVSTYLIFFWTGCLIAHFKLFSQMLFTHRLIGLASGGLLTAVISFYTVSSFLAFFTALLGIVMSFSIVKAYVDKNWSFLQFLNGYSYQIYLLSWFPQIFFKILTYQILHFPFYISYCLMAASGIVIPILVTKTLKKFNSPLLPLIGLKRKPIPAPAVKTKSIS